jgi:hypothetical protein
VSPPLCRYCGGPIAKRTRRVWITTKPEDQLLPSEKTATQFSRTVRVDKRPANIAECRALTNWQVLHVRKHYHGIASFTEWDGETYHDKFFCKGEHASAFGYAAARAKLEMPAYRDAIKLSAARSAAVTP